MFDALLWNLLLTAVLAIVLAALCRLPSMHRRPALRYWLWLLLVAKLVTPPLVAVPLLPAAMQSDTAVAAATPVDEQAVQNELVFYPPGHTVAAVHDEVSVAAEEGTEAVSSQIAGFAHASLLNVLIAVSLLGTGVLLAVYGFRAARLYRWLRRAGEENPLLDELCGAIASSMGIRKPVRSCTIDIRTTPLLLAWRGPLVVVPSRLVDELSVEQLRGIIAHELAHFLRRDHWANLFVFIVRTLLWWNPVAWWAERELRVAQELCCDAIAIDRSGANRQGYATTLLKALEFIQEEPLASHALASGMGSKVSILRRFKMIGEKRLSYRLSRWTALLLLGMAIPMVCIPVRAQEKKLTVSVKVEIEDNNKNPQTTETKQAKADDNAAEMSPGIDPEIKKLGDDVHKRITTYSDVDTLTIKDGQTGRMKVKKNVTPVAEILITPHFVKNGIKFDLEGADATGKAIDGAKTTLGTVHDAQSERTDLGKTFSIDGEDIFTKIQLTPKRTDGNSVSVEVKVLFTRLPTPEEIDALLLSSGKDGQMHLNFQKISLRIMQHKAAVGDYPKDLKELKMTLPKDVYSPTGEDYHYEAQRSRFILSSCGKDGIYGNDDDEIKINSGLMGIRTGKRHELYPLDEEDKEDDKKESVEPRSEKVLGKRPKGNCTISGKVVSDQTGEPIENARMYLFDGKTYAAIFVRTAADGTFKFADLHTGPFSLQLSLSPGYQDAFYNPDNKPGYQYVPFLLKDGEQRSGIVLKAKRAYQISGKVTDENGKVPENINNLSVLAWFKGDDGKKYRSKSTHINRADGSYLLDGLNGEPVYVMANDWQAAKKTDPYPPVYYPSTFSRDDAKQITFDDKRRVDNINIKLRKEGGLVLEGTVTDRETNAPVPKTLVTVHHVDMLFDRVTAYTDENGVYRIKCLGPGEFAVHADASPWGYVKTRKIVTIDGAKKTNRTDFTVMAGVPIHGKFVDDDGKSINIYKSAYGLAYAKGYPTPECNSWSGTDNKYSATDVFGRSRVTFNPDEGDYEEQYMIFPTRSTFVIPAVMPGDTTFRFHPKEEGKKVVKIIHNGRVMEANVVKIGDDGQDVLEAGLAIDPGQEVKDVTIVIGNGD